MSARPGPAGPLGPPGPPWSDPLLEPYRERIEARVRRVADFERTLTQGKLSLAEFASGHEYFGLHPRGGGWQLAEWAPNAEMIYLVGDFNGWKEREEFALRRLDSHGRWELALEQSALRHGEHYLLRVHWPGGSGERIPAYARRVVQDPGTKAFSAQVWRPDEPYHWRHAIPARHPEGPLIYEAHVGMAQEREGVGTFEEFRTQTLPRIARAGYDTIQLMALMEHPYYGSFGYQVSNFFAASSRFGTPEELKALVDEAHSLGLRMVMDLVHSHGVRNEREGLGLFDGTVYQYFHEGERGVHRAWDSYCFNYGKPEVAHFLLSNCRFWLDEYRIDGFRFDGVTSMLYEHHGLGQHFTDYGDYFSDTVDEEALSYLALANRLIHKVRPDAVTIAEDVSGMPGLAAPAEEGGTGFDYRMAMGVSDCWFKLTDVPDQQWDLGWLWHELNNHRPEEQTVSYVECHDQALVGGKSMLFTLIDSAMYEHMTADDTDLQVERGMALHKMMRLATLATATSYLNFMGNEFGHPEWVDFPREGNGWSYHYARRQWSLAEDSKLKYGLLRNFDRAMLDLVRAFDGFFRSGERLVCARNGDGVLAFERGGLLFFFNFHPERSHVDYSIEVAPGKYRLLMDSDEPRFGGQGRIRSGQSYHSTTMEMGDSMLNVILIYLPCRTALVLRAEGSCEP